MKRLIITEKYLVAKDIVHWLGDKSIQRKETYFETENYFVAYAKGHLFECYDIEDYTKEEPLWKLENLPFVPPNDQFYYRLKRQKNKNGNSETDPEVKKLFNTINALVNNDQVSAILHCGDADREGEVIIRQILKNTNKKNKPVYRLWFNAMTPAAFHAALSGIEPDSNYDLLATEGDIRGKEDWLYGINLTRYISLKAKAPKGMPFRAGRVLLGMLHEIYDREMEIANFVPEKYYALISHELTNGQEIRLRDNETFSIDDYITATERCAVLNRALAVVTNIKSEEKKISPGKLYSLTTLQNALAKKFGLSVTESMKYIQSVYEKGYITYPRTNTEYLNNSEKGNVKSLIELFGQKYALKFHDSKSVFDDTKVDGHSALLPTYKIPEDLSGNELLVYETVRNRFLAVFCANECRVLKSTMEITCDTSVFTINGTTLLSPGFLEYDYREINDKELPDLKVGDSINVSFSPVEEQTTPLSHYTEITFNNFLEHPFRTEKNSEDEIYSDIKKGVMIGTVATRPDIINNMIHCNYIEIKKGTYYILPAGIYLIETMQELGIDISKEKSVESSIRLSKIKNGEISGETALNEIKTELEKMFVLKEKEVKNCIQAGIISESGRRPESLVGECPLCGGGVYETLKGYICEKNKKDNSECSFFLWKNDKYVEALSGKKLNSTNVASALKKGYFNIKIKTKSNTTYDAVLRLKFTDKGIGWELVKDVGKCPVCGGNVTATPFGWICENNKKDNPVCFFVLFQNDKFIDAILHKPLNSLQIKSLLEKGKLKVIAKSKDGDKKYSLLLSLNIDKENKRISWLKDYGK